MAPRNIQYVTCFTNDGKMSVNVILSISGSLVDRLGFISTSASPETQKSFLKDMIALAKVTHPKAEVHKSLLNVLEDTSQEEIEKQRLLNIFNDLRTLCTERKIQIILPEAPEPIPTHDYDIDIPKEIGLNILRVKLQVEQNELDQRDDVLNGPWDIWQEGFVTSMECYLRASEIIARSFKEAVLKYAIAEYESSEEFRQWFNVDTLKLHGCKWFDNEADARKSSGN